MQKNMYHNLTTHRILLIMILKNWLILTVVSFIYLLDLSGIKKYDLNSAFKK